MKDVIKKNVIWYILTIVILGVGFLGVNSLSNDFIGRFGSVYLSAIKRNVIEYDKVSNDFIAKFSEYSKTTDKNFEHNKHLLFIL